MTNKRCNRKPTRTRDRAQVGVVLSLDVIDVIDTKARSEGRSRASWVRRAVRRALGLDVAAQTSH